MASANHLDDLLNIVYTEPEYGAITAQSEVATPTTISSVTLTTTGAPGMISSGFPQATFKIVAVNDANNTITLSALINGTESVGSQTDFVFGFGPNGILISPNTEADVANEYMTGENSIADSLLSILSPTPITAGMTETFTATGSTASSSSTSSNTSTTGPGTMTGTGGGAMNGTGPGTMTGTPTVNVLDTTTGKPVLVTVQPYTGPVANLQHEYINITPDNLNVGVTTPNWFIHSGSGEDAISVSSGTNVVDGGTGSNFLTAGSGSDTFFIDDRGATADIWSTINNFHAGDSATIWGVTPQDFGLTWVDGQGATGFTGLTLHATEAGKPTASMTLKGFTMADMTNGRLAVSFGTDPASGSNYMFVHSNS